MTDSADSPGQASNDLGQKPRPSLLMLIAISTLGPLALNILVPSMPGMQSSFGVDYATVQLTLTLYLIGMAGCQVFYGPLSDHFGRRPVLLGGLCLFVLAGIAGALAPSIEVLIAARLAQAIGGTAGVVLARAMVRDLFGREKAASVIGYITVVWAVAPMLAPGLGGLLEEATGSWRSAFLLLIGLGTLVLLACLKWLHETNHHRGQAHAQGSGAMALLSGYRWLVRRPRFWLYTLTLGFTSSVFFSFLGGAPYLMVEVMHRSPLDYGTWFIVVSIGWMAGNFLSGRYSQRVGVDALLLAGGALAALASLVGLILGATLGLEPWLIFLPMTFAALGNGMTMPNGFAAVASLNPAVAGAAVGLAGCLQISTGALASQAVGILQRYDTLAMFALMVGCGTAATLAQLVNNRLRAAESAAAARAIELPAE
ncbi:MFS transporter, DHA1 family, bicyclomycin/chloramphenicol resistance protein [Tistlia consotensis]|uniref:Bcr/CflA family efflux transporter n=1 Tax=Tistlia consotensis USBA 355 TaxID=560819 RepID=A0A1Y6CMR5_9PROT|nr:multidrug effflux MFS transporter [Tistlia consotensis]SMF60439.1 MFS transporter, DHA1 family, bicyclomycin/chloramphenicol resistance protein [Tistlia consotensis USBA 355]SNR93374.1 MFS transporter, DHA1 family, bicyclomycin/chloramphenicol resistance protein [Tistlia consotensis]